MAGLYDMARMTVSGAPGTGTITLLAAVAGFQTFAGAGVATGQTVSYSAQDGVLWEVGRGVYTSSGTTLTRGSLFSSSGGGAVSLTSNATIRISMLAEDLQPVPATGIVAAGTSQGTATTLTTRENYVSSVPSGTGVVFAANLMIAGTPHLVVIHEDLSTMNSLLVYPPSGVSFFTSTGLLAANASISMAAGFAAQFSIKSATVLRVISAG